MRFTKEFIKHMAFLAMSPVGDAGLDSLYHAYNEGSVRNDWPNYYRFLYHFALNAPRLKLVELGCKYGAASLHWIRGGGEAVSVDVGPHFKEHLFKGVPHQFIQGRSTSPEVVQAGALFEPDVVMIDTDHSYSTTMEEFNVWRHIVKPDGLILFDDIGVMDRDDFGCGKFFDELPATHTLKLPQLHPEGWGFGVYFMEGL